MKKIVYECLFEYQEGHGYSELVNEGFKSKLIKSLATLILTSALSLSQKQVQGMTTNEMQDKLEQIEDKVDEGDVKKYNIVAKGKTQDEALVNLTAKIAALEKHEKMKVVGTDNLNVKQITNGIQVTAEVKMISKIKSEKEIKQDKSKEYQELKKWKKETIKEISSEKMNYKTVKDAIDNKLKKMKDVGIQYKIVDSEKTKTEDGYKIKIKVKKLN